MKYLLDTHVLVWRAQESSKLPTIFEKILNKADEEGLETFVSIMSLWEVTKLVQLGKVRMQQSLAQWFKVLEESVLLHILPLTSEIVLEAMSLGQSFPKDPADQLIAATARVHGLVLLTVDDRIRNSGMVMYQK